MEYNEVSVTEKERVLLEEAHRLEEAESSASHGVPQDPAAAGGDLIRRLEEKYKGMDIKVYRITIPVTEDDDTETEYTYLFKRPGTQSYDRYVKTMSNSATKASKAFVKDNIVEELKDKLAADLEEYPAMAINISGKLLAMLGLADSIYVKKL